MGKLGIVSACLVVLATVFFAPQPGAPGIAGGTAYAMQQTAQPASLVDEVKGMYTRIQGFITASAAQFPEDKYKWQPTPEVRSWARLIGHIADDNNGTCSSVLGEKPPARIDTPNSAESAANKMSKADLEKALADAAAVCGKAFAAVTTENMMDRAGNRSKIGALVYNTSHINEHYGNLVTYMRLQNMVPPSSAGRGRGGM